MLICDLPVILVLVSVVFIESFLNAVQDTVDHHFCLSVFNRLSEGNKPLRLWLNAREGWKNKYRGRNPGNGRLKFRHLGVRIPVIRSIKVPVQVTDLWHLAKTIKLGVIIAGMIVLSGKLCPEILDSGKFLGTFMALSVIRNLNFSLFYNKILINNG